MKNAKPSAENGNPKIAPEKAMNRGHRRPSSNESVVPDTAPTAKRIPKALDQRRARVGQTSSLLRSHIPSATHISRGTPKPNHPEAHAKPRGAASIRSRRVYCDHAAPLAS